MHRSGDDLLLAATDLSTFLACPHASTLDQTAALGGPKPPQFDDPAKEVVRRRGHEHEERILEGYRAAGLRVVTIERAEAREGQTAADRWQAQAEATVAEMVAGTDVIHQGCLFDGRWVGFPDFLVREERPSRHWSWSYEVVDAKLAREAKAGAVLQISLYSSLLGQVQGWTPALMHLALGGPEGRRESFLYGYYDAYTRSVQARLLAAAEAHAPTVTYPEPCAHCDVCDWKPVCRKQWVADDHLSLVAGVTRKQRQRLVAHGVETLAALARLPLPPATELDGVGDAALTRVREQARIQLEGREAGASRYELLTDVPDGLGLRRLPAPSPGDLFFDIEGDPHALVEGLEYLLGVCDTALRYTCEWALDGAEEKAAFEAFIDGVMARLEDYPDMHVYHFGHYEPTALKRLMGRHATREDEVDRLLRGGVLVDLHRVVTQSLRASVESYSLKKLEPLFDFERAVDLRAASSALAHFEAWLALGTSEREESALLRDIQGYNADDCVSTAKLRDWLEQRRAELERITGRPLARPQPVDADASENVQAESERVAALFDALTAGVPADPLERTDEQAARWMLAHLLSWHRREKKSMWWEYFHLRDMDDDERLDDPRALAGLEYVGEVDTVKKSIVHRYRFPPQDFRIRRSDKTRDPRTEKSAGEIVAVDEDAGTIDLKRGAWSDVPHPTSLIPLDDVPDAILREALLRLADDVVANGLEGAANRAAVELLLRRAPRAGQPEGAYLYEFGEPTLVAAQRIVVRLDRTVLPVQGPPGTGKTYTGGHMIRALIEQGKRVGITATGHKVIGNLLASVCDAFGDRPFQAIQKADEGIAFDDPRIERADSNKRVHEALTAGEARLAAGTVWLWARPEMAGSVDVLVVDEAGQMSLANVLAASGAADSIVLIGDPRQLEQPQRGVHPPGTDVAALDHLVGADTLARDRGLFLDETRRLHPELCKFTSRTYYQGRLKSHYGTGFQSVHAPAPFDDVGLRFWPVPHSGNTSESPEEVAVVGWLVQRLLHSPTTWADFDGNGRQLTPADILVVAPYNAQIAALRAALPAGVRAGTVDKFQGQQAPIVIYSTATSTAEDAPRGMEFLFSPNRFNVATSRAKCIVVWVGSPALLSPECRSERQMYLANGVCRFGEMARWEG